MVGGREKRRERREDANAEIIGVVVLIGILVLTVGLVTTQVFSMPPPLKVPAASLQITNQSDFVIVEHLGGDSLPLGELEVRIVYEDPVQPSSSRSGDFRDRPDTRVFSSEPFKNGDSFRVNGVSGGHIIGAALVWIGSEGAAVLAAFGDGLGPLVPGQIVGDYTPGPIYTPRTQPPVPTATTNWSSNWTLIANFTFAPPAGTAPLPVAFTDTSSGVNQTDGTSIIIDGWHWVFGDGYFSDEQNPPPHDYLVAGTYTVTLQVWNSTLGLSAQHQETVTVTEGIGPANASFMFVPQCDKYTYSFEPTVGFTHTMISWDFGDGSNPVNYTRNGTTGQIEGVVFHPYLTPGPYTVRMNASSPYVNGGQNVTVERLVTPPVATADFYANDYVDINSPREGFAPFVVQFHDISTNAAAGSHRWDFGDGTTSSDVNPIHTYSEPGRYTVTLTVRSVDCWESTANAKVRERYIEVYAPTDVDFTADHRRVLENQVVSFTDLSTGGNITARNWSFGDGQFSTEQNPVHSYTTHGDYTVSLTVINGNYTNSTPKPGYIHVIDPMSAQFGVNVTEGIEDLWVQFTDQTSTLCEPSAWSWDFGDGATSTEQHPVHIYTEPGIYTIQMTASNDLNSDPERKFAFIRVWPAAHADFSIAPDPAAVGDTVSFINTSTGGPMTSLTWSCTGTSTTPGFPVSGEEIQYLFTTSGTYQITLTVDNGHDTDSITKTLIVNPPPTTIPTTSPTTVPTTLAPGAITGMKWADLDRDGIRDLGEPGLPGWTIQIYRKVTNDYVLVTTTTTDASGYYGFGNLEKGMYEVREVMRSGFTQTAPPGGVHSEMHITGSTDYFTDRDFGNYLGDVSLNGASKSSIIVPDTYLQFRVTGLDSYITIGGEQISLPVGTTARLVIGSNGTGEINAGGTQITTFNFDDIDLYLDDALRKSGTTSGIYVRSYDSIESTLRLVMPSRSGWQQFVIGSTTFFNGESAQAVTLNGLRPSYATGTMNLANGGTYYVGGAVDYLLPS